MSVRYKISIILCLLTLSLSSCMDGRKHYEYTPIPGVKWKKIYNDEPVNSPAENTQFEHEQTTSSPASYTTGQGNSGLSARSGYYSEPDYFKMGYDDGYEDGCHLEKGRKYNYTLKGAAAREYRRGYYEGYPDGRADNDPDDEYLYGKNAADYYDMKDDDDWSDNDDEDWEEDDDWEDDDYCDGAVDVY